MAKFSERMDAEHFQFSNFQSERLRNTWKTRKMKNEENKEIEEKPKNEEMKQTRKYREIEE